MKRSVFAVFIALCLFAFTTASFAQRRPPLILDFVVDAAIIDRAGNTVDIYEIIRDIVGRASLIFNLEIGRALSVGQIKIVSPPIKNRDETISPEPLFAWLANQDNGGGRFIVFLSEAPFFDLNHNRLLGGNSRDRRILVEYVFEIQRITFVILHEIGHLCGANHSPAITSIMSTVTNIGISYEDAILTIQKNCG